MGVVIHILHWEGEHGLQQVNEWITYNTQLAKVAAESSPVHLISNSVLFMIPPWRNISWVIRGNNVALGDRRKIPAVTDGKTRHSFLFTQNKISELAMLNTSSSIWIRTRKFPWIFPLWGDVRDSDYIWVYQRLILTLYLGVISSDFFG